MTAREITAWGPHLHGAGRDGPRRLALILMAISAVAVSLYLSNQPGPFTVPIGGDGSLVQDHRNTFPPDAPWRLGAAAALLVGLVFRRLPVLAESFFVLAATSGWSLDTAEPSPVSLGLWLAPLAAAALFEAAGSTSRATAARLTAVAALGAAVWITGLIMGSPDSDWIYDAGPVAAGILVARRYGRAVWSLLSSARQERAEQRRAGISITLLTALLDQAIPGRALSRLSASEAARSSIATDLHAEVMPRVAAVVREAERIGAADLAVEARELGETVRSLMSRDRPVTLEALGFVLAIESLGQEIARRHRLAVTVDVVNDSGEPPSLVARAGYRTAQEWLENVGRHAHARSIRVTVSCEPTVLEMRLADDGTGFDPGRAAGATQSGHLGLTGLRAEAEAVGAKLEVRPLPSRGTETLWRWER